MNILPQLAVESVFGDLEPLPILTSVVLENKHVVGFLGGCGDDTK